MSSKKFLVDIDLNGNALNNSTIGTNTSMTEAGSFRFDGTRLEYYDGSSIQQVANLNDITGGLNFQGGYDADTNTPNLTSPTPGTIFKGYYYVVTVAGTFFTEPLAIGDSLFANVNDPASLTDWTIVQGNVDLATTTTPGITYLATSAQVTAGTETGAYAVNPATLQGKINAQSYTAVIAPLDWTLSGGSYYYVINHNLGFGACVSSVYIDGILVEIAQESTSPNSTTVYVNDLPVDNTIISLVKAGGNL